jgi:siroheme synthase-like protein
VTVVAPDLHPDFSSWQAEGKLKIHQRPYSQGDLAGQRMVLACTNDRQLNRAIIEEARKRGIWGASATTGTEADLFPGATFRRGALSLSLSSTGLAPVAVRALRECLEDLLDDRWAGLFEELGHERQEHLAHGREAMEGIVQKVRAQFAESVERYQRRALKVEEEGRSTA